MSIADPPCGIFLDAIDDALTIDVGRHAVEDEVSDRIWQEVQLAGAVEVGQLEVDVLGRFLVGDDIELVELVLMLIERCRIEIGHPERREARRLPRIVGDLIGAVRDPADEAQAAGRIEHGRQIEEALFLRRAVVNGVMRGGRIFYSEIAAEITPRDEILCLPDRPAIFEAWRNGAVAAAVNADAAGIVERVRSGLDVENAGRAQAILRGQRARQQRQIADDAGIEDLSEGADAVGQHDAVDPILKIAVLVADMQFAAGRGVLRDAGQLQQGLVQRRVVALR